MRYRLLFLSSLLLCSCAGKPATAICLTMNRMELSIGQEKQISVFEGTGPFAYSSDAPEIAAVDSNGLVKALAEGEARIRVDNGSDSASCVVIVRKEAVKPVPYQRQGVLSFQANCPSFGLDNVAYRSPAKLVTMGDDSDSACFDVVLPISEGLDGNDAPSSDASLANLQALHSLSSMPEFLLDHPWSPSYEKLGTASGEILEALKNDLGEYVEGDELNNRLAALGQETLSLTYSSYFLEGAVFQEKEGAYVPHYYENRDIPLKEYASRVDTLASIVSYFFDAGATGEDYLSLIVPIFASLPIAELEQIEIDEDVLLCFAADTSTEEGRNVYSIYLKEDNAAFDKAISGYFKEPVDAKKLRISAHVKDSSLSKLTIAGEFEQGSQSNSFNGELTIREGKEKLDEDYFDRIEQRNAAFRD